MEKPLEVPDNAINTVTASNRPRAERRLTDLLAAVLLVVVGCVLVILSVSFFQSDTRAGGSNGEEVFGVVLMVTGVVLIAWGGYEVFRRVGKKGTPEPPPKPI